MGIVLCHPDDSWCCPISSGWHNVIWTLSHPDELVPGRMSSGWLLDTAVWHPDDKSYRHMSSGWLRRNWFLIRMSYDNVIMSSGWHTLPFLSHPDEIANFDFPHHAVALQRFRNFSVMDIFDFVKVPIRSFVWHSYSTGAVCHENDIQYTGMSVAMNKIPWKHW